MSQLEFKNILYSQLEISRNFDIPTDLCAQN